MISSQTGRSGNIREIGSILAILILGTSGVYGICYGVAEIECRTGDWGSGWSHGCGTFNWTTDPAYANNCEVDPGGMPAPFGATLPGTESVDCSSQFVSVTQHCGTLQYTLTGSFNQTQCSESVPCPF